MIYAPWCSLHDFIYQLAFFLGLIQSCHFACYISLGH